MIPMNVTDTLEARFAHHGASLTIGVELTQALREFLGIEFDYTTRFAVLDELGGPA